MSDEDTKRIAADVLRDVAHPGLPFFETTQAQALQAAMFRDCGIHLYDSHARALVRAGWRAPQ
jgi:hypothetical protein